MSQCNKGAKELRFFYTGSHTSERNKSTNNAFILFTSDYLNENNTKTTVLCVWTNLPLGMYTSNLQFVAFAVLMYVDVKAHLGKQTQI